MGDFLSDLLNDRLETAPMRGLVHGVLNYEIQEEEDKYSDSDPESDTEQREYILREMNSYCPEPQETGGLNDIDVGHEESILGTDIVELLHVPKVFDIYKFDAYYKKPLPIDSFRNKILNMVNTNSVMIIHGPTGCGKTTQVPQYILDQCKETKSPCNIIVTQPRRIAAINIAQRVCEERGWALGTVCGYQVGLDRNVGEDVVLTYVTTEVLLQKLIHEKNLNRYTHVIIDEVHERDKSLDFLLLIVRKYLFTNSPGVKVVLMSATMEADEFAYYFRSVSRTDVQMNLLAPVLNVDKKSEYSVHIYYNDQRIVKSGVVYDINAPCITREQYLMCQKFISLFDNLDRQEQGCQTLEHPASVLVFLPGFHEIESMMKILEECEQREVEWDIIPLHSSLSSDHMVKVFKKPSVNCRKIILSTNIAESSVTVPDVKYVIDFCLTKIMTLNEITKFCSLTLQWASHNNCTQRAGRVGRVGNGRVYRLVPKEFYEDCILVWCQSSSESADGADSKKLWHQTNILPVSRQNQMQKNSLPEMQRAPLEHIILYMKMLELHDTPKNVLSLAISPPNLRDVETCIWRLKEAGALLQTCRGHRIAADGDLTFLGKIMGSLPIDIHLSKLIVLGHLFSCLDEAVIMAAGCMTSNIFVQNFHDRIKCYRKKLLWADGSCSDFMILLNLYDVWLSAKRQNRFSNTNDEYAWCKTNFVNLKGLREWDLLIKEIHSRLKRFSIEKAMGATAVKLSPIEKPTVLKIIICGAFYPNYFIRTADFGQVDAKEAVKILNGRDPLNTVYFTNMKVNQPGHIYVRQIKKMIGAESSPHVQIGFDAQSTRVFVEFKNVRQPEAVAVEGRQYIMQAPGHIAVDVYESVRKRQMGIQHKLKILSNQRAWAFAETTERRQQEQAEEVYCYTRTDYSPLPTLDMEYITVIITHIVDAGQFYCQNFDDETTHLLARIFGGLNAPGVLLDPVRKVSMDDRIYAARFLDDGKYYRCKIVSLTPGRPDNAQVQFIDYGNTQKVPATLICDLPDSPDLRVRGLAMCCVLSEIKPDLVKNPTGIWCERVNSIFKKKTENKLLNAKVYSVVDDIVHMELFAQNPGRNSVSFNQYLINEGFATACEESQRSQIDHETRIKVLSSEDPNNMNSIFQQMSTAKNYTDFEEPEYSDYVEEIVLRGPYSPLEMKVCGMVEASVGATVRIDGDSVNAALLDNNAEDSHSRLLVAARVAQTSSGSVINASQTTLMPTIPGLPMLVTLLFCPQMEPKLTQDRTRVASILCGLGYKEHSNKPNYPMHDISLVLDTELNHDLIGKITEIRHFLNRAIKTASNIYDEISYPHELHLLQKDLKLKLFNLLHVAQKTVDRVNVKFANVWQKNVYDEADVLFVDQSNDPDDIWPHLSFVRINTEGKISVKKNLDEMMQIAKRLIPEREIVCELCKGPPLKDIGAVRVHLFKAEHKAKLDRYNAGRQLQGED